MSERTPQSQSVGVSISGTVGTARDIVGRDKITFNVGSVPEEVAGEVIRQTDERRKATADMSGIWADASEAAHNNNAHRRKNLCSVFFTVFLTIRSLRNWGLN